MNINRMREGLKIICEECPRDCRGCPYVFECPSERTIGEIAEYMLDYCEGGKYYDKK